ARADGVDPDVAAGEVSGERLGEADRCGLGDGIGGPVRHALDRAGDGCHVADGAVTALEHLGQHRPDGANLRLDVEIERKVEIVVAHLEQRAVVHDPGTVEQHIDTANVGDSGTNSAVRENVEDAYGDIL